MALDCKGISGVGQAGKDGGSGWIDESTMCEGPLPFPEGGEEAASLEARTKEELISLLREATKRAAAFVSLFSGSEPGMGDIKDRAKECLAFAKGFANLLDRSEGAVEELVRTVEELEEERDCLKQDLYAALDENEGLMTELEDCREGLLHAEELAESQNEVLMEAAQKLALLQGTLLGVVTGVDDPLKEYFGDTLDDFLQEHECLVEELPGYDRLIRKKGEGINPWEDPSFTEPLFRLRDGILFPVPIFWNEAIQDEALSRARHAVAALALERLYEEDEPSERYEAKLKNLMACVERWGTESMRMKRHVRNLFMEMEHQDAILASYRMEVRLLLEILERYGINASQVDHSIDISHFIRNGNDKPW